MQVTYTRNARLARCLASTASALVPVSAGGCSCFCWEWWRALQRERFPPFWGRSSVITHLTRYITDGKVILSAQLCLEADGPPHWVVKRAHPAPWSSAACGTCTRRKRNSRDKTHPFLPSELLLHMKYISFMSKHCLRCHILTQHAIHQM